MILVTAPTNDRCQRRRKGEWGWQQSCCTQTRICCTLLYTLTSAVHSHLLYTAVYTHICCTYSHLLYTHLLYTAVHSHLLYTLTFAVHCCADSHFVMWVKNKATRVPLCLPVMDALSAHLNTMPSENRHTLYSPEHHAF